MIGLPHAWTTEDGYIKVPQGPGLGVTFRADLIERT